MSNVLVNSYEDFIDELSSNLIYKESKSIFEPLKDKFRSSNPTVYDEAVESAITTLQYGVSSKVLQYVNEYMYEKLLKVGSSIFLYILSGSVIKGAKNKLRKALTRAKGKGFRGRALQGFLGLVSPNSDKANRIEESKIAMSMLDRYEDTVNAKNGQYRKDKEYLNKVVLDGSKQNKESSLAQYTHKTKTATWKNTSADKALYKRATNQTLVGVSFSRLVLDLNKFGEYAVDAENKMLNLAQTNLDTLSAQNIERIR